MSVYYWIFLYILIMVEHGRILVHYQIYPIELPSASFVRKLLGDLFQYRVYIIMIVSLIHLQLRGMMGSLGCVVVVGLFPFSVGGCLRERCFLCSILWPFSEHFRLLHILGQQCQGLYSLQRSPFVFCNRVYIQLAHEDHSLSLVILWCLEDNFEGHWPCLGLLMECVRYGYHYYYSYMNC